MDSITILFYLKSRENKSGERQIYLRLTVNGKRRETSLNRSISYSRWDKHRQCGKGRTEDIQRLNKLLDSTKNDIYDKQREMDYNDEDITAETLMNKFLGKGNRKRYLIELIKEESHKKKNLIGTGTYRKYKAFLHHIEKFLEFQYQVSDISIKKVDYEFISDFDYYIRTEKSIGNNTTVRYVKTLELFFNKAKNRGWVNTDPFVNYEGTLEKVERTILSEVELNLVISKTITIDRLKRIRDIFVFACFSGLSFGDLEKLNSNHIVIDMEGIKWIKIKRSKTGNSCSIPLLPQAEEILKKYKGDPQCLNKGVALPVISNERYNSYLKEIAVLCGIDKNLTTHVARHTFATTVSSDKGVSIEVISKMLGHTQLKTTQIYAKTTDVRIANEMAGLIDVNLSSDDLTFEAG